jgi:contractile injection system tube protein/LysM domain-containing protein
MGTAKITEWDMAKGQPLDTAQAVKLVVDFDPQSLELTYTATGAPASSDKTSSGTWNKTPAQQTGQSATLSVTLMFDTTTSNEVSVQTETDPLVLLTLPNNLGPKGPTRRVVCFQWGTFLFFGCVDSMTQTIDFFSDSGVPLRASVHLALSQVGRPDQPSNPGGPGPKQSYGANVGIGAPAPAGTSPPGSGGLGAGAGPSAGLSPASASAGVGATPLTLSQAGDTIQGIAARSGGSVSWKAVAIANNIDNPRLLPAGTVLSLSAGAQLSADSG